MRALSVCLWTLLLLFSETFPQTSPENFMRGIHIGGNWGENRLRGITEQPPDYYDWLETLSPNWVAIIVELYLDSYTDDSVELDYNEHLTVPSLKDDAFRTFIRGFKKRNINVLVSMSLNAGSPGITPNAANRWQLGDPYAYQTDQNINRQNWPWDPANVAYTNYVNNFWSSYTNCISHVAALCEEEGVDIFSIGIETDRLFRTRSGPGFPNHFKNEIQNVIAEARKHYSGIITYQMHWSALNSTELEPGSGHLWEDLDLDIIGLSAYFKLTESSPSRVLGVQELEAAWNNVFTNILIPLKNRNQQRKIIFIEYGYVDVLGSPFFADADSFINKVFTDSNGNGKDDGEEQQYNIYSSFFNVNDNNGRLVEGAFMFSHEIASNFNWANGPGKLRNHSIRNKLSETLIKSKYVSYTPAPTIPLLSAPPGGSNFKNTDTIQFTWAQAKGEWNRYNLQIGPDTSFSSITDSVMNLQGFSFRRAAVFNPGTYYWRVQSENAKGSSQWPSPFSFCILLPLPGRPKLISPGNGEKNVSLSARFIWEKPVAAESYEIEISGNSNLSDPFFLKSGITDTTCIPENLQNGKTYYWHVCAKNSTGDSEWSETFSFTTIAGIPQTPACIYPPDGAINLSTEIHFRWNKSLHAENYHFQLSERSDFAAPEFNFENLADSSKTITGLKNSTAYFWHVRSGNSAGQSSWSPVYSLTTETAVGIEDDEDTPKEFRLYQNYPNPFLTGCNSLVRETTIEFTISMPEETSFRKTGEPATSLFTKLIIYDVLGREIAILVNENKFPGTYSVKFDGGNLPCGIYFYVLTAHKYRTSKKMIIIR